MFDGETGENVGRLLDVPEGALGVRQSDALFMHVKWLPEVFARLPFKGKAAAVGASAAPREVEGSYMPCFLAGVSHGAVLARGLGVPFHKFSHQQGHVAAAAWSAGRTDLLETPFLCWHLSGGTTELLKVTPCPAAPAPPDAGPQPGEDPSPPDAGPQPGEDPSRPAATQMSPSKKSVTCEILGGTTDVSAGQLIDRAGNMLNMKFPSGEALDILAMGDERCEGYVPKVDACEFSLSGVEHKMKAMVAAGRTPGEIAYFVFRAVTSAVGTATGNARKRYGDLPVLYSGGVASSRFMRRELPDGIYAQPKYSSDNAMGIAILTFREIEIDGG